MTHDTPNFEGKFEFRNVFLSDATDVPCSTFNIKPNINLKKTDVNTYELSGKSYVNSFFGTLKIIETKENYSTIEIKTLGSTKMAGDPALMQCETQLFELLRSSENISLIENTLNIGVFKKDNTPFRDGGTFLVFSKSIP